MKLLEGLEGVICITDDILVYGEGSDNETAEAHHDVNFTVLIDGTMLGEEYKTEFAKRYSLN